MQKSWSRGNGFSPSTSLVYDKSEKLLSKVKERRLLAYDAGDELLLKKHGSG